MNKHLKTLIVLIVVCLFPIWIIPAVIYTGYQLLYAIANPWDEGDDTFERLFIWFSEL